MGDNRIETNSTSFAVTTHDRRPIAPRPAGPDFTPRSINKPNKKDHHVSKTAVASVLAVATAATGAAAWALTQRGGGETPGQSAAIVEPSSSPMPSESAYQSIIVESPTPSPTEAPTSTPTAETTQSPTPSPTEKPTPAPTETPEPSIPSIEKVKLVSPGEIKLFPYGTYPYFFADMQNATVVDKEYDKEKNILKFAVTSKGKQITKTDCEDIIVSTKDGQQTVNFCVYKGMTLYFEVSSKTLVTSGSQGADVIGSGPEVLDKYLKVGEPLPSVRFGHAWLGDGRDLATKEQIEMNKKSWENLEKSVGKSYPRTYEGFTFFTGVIAVKP